MLGGVDEVWPTEKEWDQDEWDEKGQLVKFPTMPPAPPVTSLDWVVVVMTRTLGDGFVVPPR